MRNLVLNTLEIAALLEIETHEQHLRDLRRKASQLPRDLERVCEPEIALAEEGLSALKRHVQLSVRA
jgi:hypothetical protein